jgi:hypothetical protein
MQRKNHILRSPYIARNGMAMIMAIVVIVIISTIIALSLSLTATTSKRTTDLYLYEQSVLLSKSATEYALLQISQNDPCTYTGSSFIQDDIYNIKISVSYVYLDTENYCSTNGGTQYATVETEEQSGSALIDVTIGVNDPNVSTEEIRYFRRTIQKL